MTEAVSRILTEIDRLSQPERAELAFEVLRSLDPPGGKPVGEFDAELSRRLEEIRAGKVAGIPADEVFARLKARRS
ncbi:MAG: addiction module protein [Gemmataceae bacterium]